MAPTIATVCAFAALLLPATSAVPFGFSLGGSLQIGQGSKPKHEHPSGTTTATLPLYELGSANNGTTALPTPTTQPKYIALGIGFQNYTCATTTATPNLTYVQTKPSTGALANLYEVTKNVDRCNVDYLSAEALNAFELCILKTKCSPVNNGCAACNQAAISYVRARGAAPAPQIGLHFFETINNTQTPSFNLFAYGDFLSGKKVGDVKAPANSNNGTYGYGAVDWLYLTNNGNGLTHGLSSVYRVVTAGGAAPKNCSTAGQVTYQPYSAEYWFYA